MIASLTSGPRAVARIVAITAQEAGPFADAITPEGYLRLLPDSYQSKNPDFTGGNDGFFIARLQRI